MVEEKIRANFGDYLAHAEVAIYSVLAVLLFITALATIANAGKMLWDGIGHWTIAAETLRVLDQLLVVLMLVEILHTVRISIRSHFLVTEPFLVVGLIASIRRILVITLEAANLTKAGSFSAENPAVSVRAEPEEQPGAVNRRLCLGSLFDCQKNDCANGTHGG
jgi:uncharacterized membrane protein (DUF373 family)